MMDVQWHWTNLWWAGKRRNWPLAQYYFNEARGHIQQLVRKNPTIRNQVDRTDVELQGIFDGIDTSSLAMVKDAIEKKDGVVFEKNYRTMLESCYACHKSVGRPYIRPQIPTAQVQAMVDMDPDRDLAAVRRKPRGVLVRALRVTCATILLYSSITPFTSLWTLVTSGIEGSRPGRCSSCRLRSCSRP